MVRIFTGVLILLFVSLSATAQKNLPDEITVLFYNVDSFFDTTDDTGAADDKYSSEGLYVWDADRYQEKVKSVAEIISTATGNKQPDIIGVAGVENKNVINDILNERRLRRADYDLSMTESEGLNVALIVKKDLMAVQQTESISIDTTFLKQKERFNCDILYVSGELKGLGTCHLLINHWPGIEQNRRAPENLRIGAAVALRKKVDEILNFERNARIIIMGTFNDEPTNRSLMTILNATNKRKNLDYRDLYNLYYDKHNNSDEGTAIVNGTWQMWDQIITTPSLLNSSYSYYTGIEGGRIFLPDNIKEDINNLKHTYVGGEYTGSPSGHLPVYCKIRKKKEE